VLIAVIFTLSKLKSYIPSSCLRRRLRSKSSREAALSAPETTGSAIAQRIEAGREAVNKTITQQMNAAGQGEGNIKADRAAFSGAIKIQLIKSSGAYSRHEKSGNCDRSVKTARLSIK
jgi:hypothetical protein